MGLERIHLYHFVRVLRVVVPLLVVASASLFAWNYRGRLGDERPDETEPRLEENMTFFSEGVKQTQGEGGGEAFTVSGGEYLGFEGGVSQLQGEVEIAVSGDGETPGRLIRGPGCDVEQQAGMFECEGGIEIELDDRTIARTERVTYDDETGTASAPTSVQIVRLGEFELRADSMRVLYRERLVYLEGNVTIDRPGGSKLEAGALRYDERSGSVTLSGGVWLRSDVLELSGERATATFLPQSTTLSGIEVRENVRAQSLDDSDPGGVVASELDVDVVSGRVEAIRARGGVVVESGRQVLSGDVLAATFGAEGEIESLESVGNAEMTLESGETIRSNLIRQTGDRLIETGDDSVLRGPDLTVEGHRFQLEQQDGVRFNTDHPASISLPGGVLSGDRTRAAFDTDAGTLLSLEQTGSVQFDLDGRKGRSESVHVDDVWVEFRGDVSIEDPEYTLEAETIRLHRTNPVVEAEGGVFLVTRLEGEPVTVTSDELRGRGDEAMQFTGAVVLRRGGTEVRATEIDVDPGGRAFVARERVLSVMDGLTVHADSLAFDDQTGRIRYSGQVRARTEELSVDSQTLLVTLLDREIERIDATGEVEVRSREGLEGRSDRAVYLQFEGTVTLSGTGAEARDLANGRCVGDRIVVDIRTHDVSVHSQDGGRAVCMPYAGQENSGIN